MSLKGLPAVIRLHRHKLEERSKVLRELERLRQKLLQAFSQLEAELVGEQHAARGGGPASFAYGGYAEAVVGRRTRIAKSLEDVDQQLERARADVSEAFAELKKYETVLANRERKEQERLRRAERIVLDEIGATIHRRRRKTS